MPENGQPEPFADRLRRLAAERDTSVERIASDAWDRDTAGTSPSHLKKVIRGERRLNVALIEAIAGALGVPPEEFPEYRLAVARRTLDEREVGLEEALAMLEAIEEALLYPRAADGLERLAAEQNAATDQTRPASTRGPRSRSAS